MRGLTLWCPWPYTIFHLEPTPRLAPKRLENRSKPPPRALIGGERIGLHAGLGWDPNALATCRDHGVTLPGSDATFPRERGSDAPVFCHPKGVIQGVVRVVGWVEGERGVGQHPGLMISYFGVSFDRAREVVNDPWFIGPYAWVLEDVEALARPVVPNIPGRKPGSGAQGLWVVDPAAAREVMAQLAGPL